MLEIQWPSFDGPKFFIIETEFEACSAYSKGPYVHFGTYNTFLLSV